MKIISNLKTQPCFPISEWEDALASLLKREEDIKLKIARVREEIKTCQLAKRGRHDDRNESIAADVLAGNKMTAVAKKYKLHPVTVRSVTHKYCKKKNRHLYKSGEREYQDEGWTRTLDPTTDWLCVNRSGFGFKTY